MARFAQFAIAATEEALEDAAWRPTTDEQREATVCHLAFPSEFMLQTLIVVGGLLGIWYWQF